MGSLTHLEIGELQKELTLNFSEIIRLNHTNLKKLENNEITNCTAIVPDGVLKNNLHFITDETNICISICFGHNILTNIFKNNVDSFIKDHQKE
jgi:hypothetical protein